MGLATWEGFYNSEYFSLTDGPKKIVEKWEAFKASLAVSEEKKPLFTTEDGKDLFDRDDIIWAIDKKTLNRTTGNGNTIGTWLNGWYTTSEIPNPKENDENVLRLVKEGWVIFSTENLANDYVLMNKPCLSLNDIEKSCKVKHDFAGYEFGFINTDKLKQLAQSKIKGGKE